MSAQEAAEAVFQQGNKPLPRPTAKIGQTSSKAPEKGKKKEVAKAKIKKPAVMPPDITTPESRLKTPVKVMPVLKTELSPPVTPETSETSETSEIPKTPKKDTRATPSESEASAKEDYVTKQASTDLEHDTCSNVSCKHALTFIFQDFDAFASQFQAIVENFQSQLKTMAALRQHIGGSPPAEAAVVKGMSIVETRLLNLFPINQLTKAMIYLLKDERVGQFIRYQIIQKLYGSFPDVKPDPEVVVTKFLEFMFSKRMQVKSYAGIPELIILYSFVPF